MLLIYCARLKPCWLEHTDTPSRSSLNNTLLSGPHEAAEFCADEQTLSLLGWFVWSSSSSGLTSCNWRSGQIQLGVKVPCRMQGSHSSRCIAAEEGIEHWLFQALLVLPTPGDHGPITVCCVQMVAVAGKGKAYNRLIRFRKCNFPHRLQVPSTP